MPPPPPPPPSVIDLTGNSSDDEESPGRVSDESTAAPAVAKRSFAAVTPAAGLGTRKVAKNEDGSRLSPPHSPWGEPLPPERHHSPRSPREKPVVTNNVVKGSEPSSGMKKGRSSGSGRVIVKRASTPPPTASSPDEVCRHFWRAGEYEAQPSRISTTRGPMDHVRVHPKFLHSNATSHKWALGAIAELLDNAVDEIPNGASFVRIDQVLSDKASGPGLMVQDDGGGMTPDSIRQCMSLGYSRKNTNTTIGQYGNGFKTSTMRLGADVIVFTRCTEGARVTQSIGLLSYTFLRKTGHEDVVVPMIDYEVVRDGDSQKKIVRSSVDDWQSNLESITQWSPYVSEAELLEQYEDMGWHGTKVIVFNLWFNDDALLELDFDTDEDDIQLRGGVKKDKVPVPQQLARLHIANRYQHSLRVYASILYLQMPQGFQIIVRGKPVQHHSIASDLKFPEQIVYKPKIGSEDPNRETAVITIIGFTKEAPLIALNGFNVYHKNRLIMPFWKVWQDNSSRGRGVVGVLEANFVEPAHDKQDFERTAVLLRLETRLKQMTIEYWNLHCHLIGYQPNTKAGKARKQAASPVVEYPSPIASLGPIEAPPTAPSIPGQQPGGLDLALPRGPKSNSVLIEGSGLPMPTYMSADQVSESCSPEGIARARISDPSTPPQPAADGLKSSSAGGPAGPRVKTEPVDPVNFASEADPSVRRHRTANQTAGGARNVALAVQQSGNETMVAELMEENMQLRSRCTGYEQEIKSLGSTIFRLEHELMEVNAKNAVQQDSQGKWPPTIHRGTASASKEELNAMAKE